MDSIYFSTTDERTKEAARLVFSMEKAFGVGKRDDLSRPISTNDDFVRKVLETRKALD